MKKKLVVHTGMLVGGIIAVEVEAHKAKREARDNVGAPAATVLHIPSSSLCYVSSV